MDPAQSILSRGQSSPCIPKTVYENGEAVTRYFCPICPSSVKRKCDFARHMRQHTGEGFFYCPEPECSNKSGFAQKSNLEQHIRAIHRGIRHNCPHFWLDVDGQEYKCDRAFSDVPSLVRHRSTKHGFDTGDDEAKVWLPTPVGMEFPNSKYLRKHRLRPKVNPGAPAALHPSASLHPESPLVTPLDAPIANPPAAAVLPIPSQPAAATTTVTGVFAAPQTRHGSRV